MRYIMTSLMAGIVSLGACSPTHSAPEAVSLLGEPLSALELAPDVREKREDDLAQARTRYRNNPLDEQRIIWYGRRLAYLGRYKDAIAVYTQGLAVHPESYRLLRHRGHRFISLRRFDEAVTDLNRAAGLIQGVPDEIELDGLPNARDIPTSTSHTNIYYHLGLAQYLQGHFEAAIEAYRRCLDFSANDDMRCATIYWLYLTHRRLGRDDEAVDVLQPITAEMQIIENFSYHKLLMLFKGEFTPQRVLQNTDAASPAGNSIDDATIGYGLGAWHLLNGRRQEASDIFQQIVSGTAWPAFGHIAAEAELARAENLRGAARGD